MTPIIEAVARAIFDARHKHPHDRAKAALLAAADAVNEEMGVAAAESTSADNAKQLEAKQLEGETFNDWMSRLRIMAIAAALRKAAE